MDYMLLIYISHCQHIEGPCEARPYHQTEIFLGQKSCLPNFGPTPPQRDGFYLNCYQGLAILHTVHSIFMSEISTQCHASCTTFALGQHFSCIRKCFLHRRFWMRILLNFFYSTTESKNSDIP